MYLLVSYKHNDDIGEWGFSVQNYTLFNAQKTFQIFAVNLISFRAKSAEIENSFSKDFQHFRDYLRVTSTTFKTFLLIQSQDHSNNCSNSFDDSPEC